MYAVAYRNTMKSARFAPPKEEPVVIDWLAVQRQKREDYERRREAKLIEDKAVLEQRRREAREAIARARDVARQFHAEDDDAVRVYRITISRIASRICRALKVTREEIAGERRSAHIVFARQAIAYWSRRLTQNSLPEIGRRMGGKDHTTVLHGSRIYPKKRAAMGRRLRPVG